MKKLEKLIRSELLPSGRKDELESEPICLSIYVQAGPPKQKCNQLKALLVESSSLLKDVLSAKEMSRFMQPLASMRTQDMEGWPGACAFFRSREKLLVVDLPVEAQEQFVVSTQFHIKPLLKWLQEEAEYFCLEFKSGRADAWKGDAQNFKLETSFGARESDKIDEWLFNQKSAEEGIPVFLCGNQKLAAAFKERSRSRGLDPSIVDRSVYNGDRELLRRVLTDRLRQRAFLKVKKALRDYSVAAMNGKAESNMDEIIEAAKEGKISKLIVSEEEKVWGRIDAAKNNANRINQQINYEDNDLLDSISEKVLESGGEVVVAKSGYLPRGKQILAILKDAA